MEAGSFSGQSSPDSGLPLGPHSLLQQKKPTVHPQPLATRRLFCKHLGNILFSSEPILLPAHHHPRKLRKFSNGSSYRADNLLTPFLHSRCSLMIFTLTFNPFLPDAPAGLDGQIY